MSPVSLSVIDHQGVDGVSLIPGDGEDGRAVEAARQQHHGWIGGSHGTIVNPRGQDSWRQTDPKEGEIAPKVL